MYNIFELKNGLRVVVENIEYVNSISFGLWIKNGSRNENLNNNGISHFIEHMFFKGTNRNSSKEIVEKIENVGGQINAFTGKEATCFYTRTLSDHIELSFDIISDMIFNSRFDDKDIEKEKSIVIEEINMSEDSPEDVLGDIHSYAIWGDDPISYPVLGTAETVNRFDKKMIKDYISKYYTPKNSVISISGKIDMNEAKKLAEYYFGDWKDINDEISSYSSPIILKNNYMKDKSIEQVHISLGLNGVKLGDEYLYPMILINNEFGGGAASRLFQKIREDLGLCYTVYSYNSTFENTGTLNIYTAVSPQYTYTAIEAIKEELDKFCKMEYKKINLDILKEQLKGTYILGSESVSSRMFANGKSLLFLNQLKTPDDVMKKINSITMDDIDLVVNKTFKKGILNSALVGSGIDIEKINGII